MSTSVAPVGQVVSFGAGALEARCGADERADRDRERHGG
jgi:hypothetical protein